MALYIFDAEDIADLGALIGGANLSITGAMARRVFELQSKLGAAQPVPSLVMELEAARRELELERQRHEVTEAALHATERERQEWVEKHAALLACSRDQCDPATCGSHRHTL